MADVTDPEQFREAWRSLFAVADIQAQRVSEWSVGRTDHETPYEGGKEQHDSVLTPDELAQRDAAAQRLSDLLGYSTTDIIWEAEGGAHDADYPSPDTITVDDLKSRIAETALSRLAPDGARLSAQLTNAPLAEVEQQGPMYLDRHERGVPTRAGVSTAEPVRAEQLGP